MGTTEQDLLRRMLEAGELSEGDFHRASDMRSRARALQGGIPGEAVGGSALAATEEQEPHDFTQDEASPGGLFPEQARFLQMARSSGDQFDPADELSTFDRVVGRFARGVQQEQTLGREGVFGSAAITDDVDAILNREGELDVSDFAEVAGRILGGAPLALVSGAAATRLAAATAARISTRAPAIARGLQAMATEPDKSLALWRRMRQGAAHNVLAGIGYSAVAGPLRSLDEDQSRARAVAEEFGVGAAVDFLFGALGPVAGAGARRVADALARADNTIDREVGQGLMRMMDDLEADVGGPGAQPGQTTGAAIGPAQDPEAAVLRELAINPAEETAPDRLLPGITADEAATALPAEAGGPRLARGETLTPEQAALREDVDVGRNRPFLSRFAGEETPRPAVRSDQPVGPESLAAESGGPILQRGEVPEPGRPGFQESVSVERNRPFLSRMVEGEPDVEGGDLAFIEGTEAFAGPEGQSFGFDVEAPGGATLSIAGRYIPETKTVVVGNVQGGRGDVGVGPIRQALRQIREQFPEAERVEGLRTTEGNARGREVSRELRPEDIEAPRQAEAEAPAAEAPTTGADLEIPQVSNRQAQQVLQDVAQAETAGEVFTAASNLSTLRLQGDEQTSVRAFIEQRLRQLEGRGSGVPAQRRPPPEPSPAPVAAGEAQAGQRHRSILNIESAVRAGRPMQEIANLVGTARGAGRSTAEIEAVLPEVRPGVRLEPDPEARPPRGTPERRRTARRMKSLRDENRQLKVDPLSGIVGGPQARRAVDRVDADPNQKYIGFDLTVFKSINDELGMGAGDDRIREIGRILQQVGEEFGFDTRNLIRSGGDEFAIIVPADMPAERIKVVGDRVVELAGELELPSGARSGVRFGEGATHEAAQAAAAEQVAKSIRGEQPAPAPEPEAPAKPELEPHERRALKKFGFDEQPPLRAAYREEDVLDLRFGHDSFADFIDSIDQFHTAVTEEVEGPSTFRGFSSPEQIRDNMLENVDELYGTEVGDQVRTELGLNPRDLEPSLAEQATAIRHADAAARSYTPGEDVGGVRGKETAIITPEGNLKAEYRLIPHANVKASHDPVTWNPTEGYYPTGAVQQRDYLRNPAAQESVVEISTKPNNQALLDRSQHAQNGLSTLSPDGLTVAGNGREMAKERMRRLAPEKWQAYLEDLRASAEEYGYTADQITDDVDVYRVLVDESVDFGNIDQVRELNILFDKPVGKAKTAVEDAASRAAILKKKQGEAALATLSEIDPEQTLRAWLSTSQGKAFTKQLRDSGFFTTEEVGEMIDTAKGTLTERGRDVVEETLLVAAVGDVDAVRAAPPSIKQRVEHAVPGIIRAQGTDWDLGPAVREALELHARLEQNPEFSGRKGKVFGFRGQGDIFGEGGVSERVLDMAQSIEDGSKRDVTEAFRTYFREMDIATRQGANEDLFGFEPKTPEQAFDQSFGAFRRLLESKRKKCQ